MNARLIPLLGLCSLVVVGDDQSPPAKRIDPSVVCRQSEYCKCTRRFDREAVWAIAQTTYLSGGDQKILLRGTTWLFSSSGTQLVFATCWHVLRPLSEGVLQHPEEVQVSVSLMHVSGTVLPVRRENILAYEEKDLAFIILSRLEATSDTERSSIFNPLPMISGTHHVDDLIGKDVYNLGFPLRAQIEVSTQDQPVFRDVVSMQSGKIVDGTIEHRVFPAPTRCFTVDYPSEPGFSGGPLRFTESQEVIGLMASVIIPEGDDAPSTTSHAISMDEVYNGYHAVMKRHGRER